MTEEKKEKKAKKQPAPVKFYALVAYNKSTPDGSEGERTQTIISADKKSELYKRFEGLDNINVLMCVRGRLIDIKQKVSFRI